jgi:hypothetical protein
MEERHTELLGLDGVAPKGLAGRGHGFVRSRMTSNPELIPAQKLACVSIGDRSIVRG